MVEYTKQVTAAIIRKDGKILIAKRSGDDECPLMWEFPGGKLEAGETLEECIVREIKEELGLDIQVVNIYARILYHLNGQGIPITFFNVEITGGEMRLYVHEDARWIEKKDLFRYRFMPPDIEVVSRLSEEEWK